MVQRRTLLPQVVRSIVAVCECSTGRGIGEASMRGLRYVAAMTPFLYMGSYSEYSP